MAAVAVTSMHQLAPEIRSELLRLAVSGELQILTGAGASADSTTRHDDGVPLAADLTRRLSNEFGVSPDGGLALCYERACRGDRTEDVYRFLRSIYTGTSPATWYRDFVRLPWKRIWTLNIDDVLREAYRRWNPTEWVEHVSFDEPYSDRRGVQVCYLHGNVNSVVPTALVFSILEYLRARDARRSWHSIFGDQWARHPFVVVGAALRDEVDLADIVRLGRPKGAPNCFYVSPHIDDTSAEDLEAWGLIPICQSGEAFIREIADAAAPLIPQNRSPLDHTTAPGVSAFLQQFRMLALDAEEAVPRDHDFYRGDHPRWADIAQDLDAKFAWPRVLAESAMDSVRSGSRRLVVAAGPRLSGRSTGLLQAARLLIEAGFQPFLFRNEEAFEWQSARAVVDEHPSAVLLFDGIADYAKKINRILRDRRDANRPLTIVSAERDVRLPLLLADVEKDFFSTNDLIEIQEIVPTKRSFRARRDAIALTESDARSLVTKLSVKGRLGTFQGWHEADVARHFQKVGLFPGLAEATNGRTFRRRIVGLTEQISSESDALLLALVTVIDSLGYASPLEVVDVVRSVAGEVPLVTHEPLREFLLMDRSRIEARHRTMPLEPVLSSLERASVGNTIVEFHRFFKPYLNRVTMAAGSPISLIAAGLMKARSLEHWIGRKNLRRHFDSLEELYGEWNPRYWEQRAIASEITNDWESAESYAARAATDIQDDKRHTTLGTILLRRAVFDAHPGDERSLNFFRRGVQIFEVARRFNPDNHVPSLACLSGILRLGQAHKKEGRSLHDLYISEWNKWYSHARSCRAAAFPHIAREIEDLNFEWLSLFAADA